MPAAKPAAKPAATPAAAKAETKASPPPTRISVGLIMDCSEDYDYYRPSVLRFPYLLTEAIRLRGHLQNVTPLRRGCNFVRTWASEHFPTRSPETSELRWGDHLNFGFGRTAPNPSGFVVCMVTSEKSRWRPPPRFRPAKPRRGFKSPYRCAGILTACFKICASFCLV